MEMKKNSIKLIFTLIVLGIILISYLYSANSNINKRGFVEIDLSSAKQITCTYPQTLSVNYRDNIINHILPKKESNPIIFTFSNLKDSSVDLSYIDSTQTINTLKVVKLIDSPDRYIFIEGGVDNYFTTHTIFKKKGVSIYSKSVDIIGTPAGTLAMGSCTGY